MLFDTPGQIEVFTWSASGAIITESLASSFPTVVAYVMDTARCVNPVTFMSNMLYACSIMYRTKLPFIVVLNKVRRLDENYVGNSPWFGIKHPTNNVKIHFVPIIGGKFVPFNLLCRKVTILNNY